MNRKSSIKIKARSIASALLHNARVFPLSYAVKDRVHNENKLYKTPRELKKLLTRIKTDYQRNAYRGRKMPTNSTPIREGVANLEAHHTLADVEKMAHKITKKMGVEILSISVHKDEGKDAENLNYHAHVLFNYYNFETHKMVHHFKADRIMQQVQDIVAEELEMERGVAKEITGIEHIPHQQWRHIAKQRAQEKQEHIKTVGELKSKINELAVELRETNEKLEDHEKLFKKEDYQKINELKSKLNKNNLDEVATGYYELVNQFQNTKDENERYRNERSGEYERAIDRVKQSTTALSASTDDDIRRIAKAFQTERSAREDSEIITSVADQLTTVLDGLQVGVRQVAFNQLGKRIKELENHEPKITFDQVKNYRITVKGKSTTMDGYVQELIAKIKKITAEKEIVEDKVSTLEGKILGREDRIDVLEGELRIKPTEIQVENPINEKLQALFKKWADFIKKFTGLDISKDEPPENNIRSVLNREDEQKPTIDPPYPKPKPKP